MNLSPSARTPVILVFLTLLAVGSATAALFVLEARAAPPAAALTITESAAARAAIDEPASQQARASSATAGRTSSVDPGQWVAELGDFGHLEDGVAFADDDVWAVGDGIVHYDGSAWRQVAGTNRPALHGIDGASSDLLWAVGEVVKDECDRYGYMLRGEGGIWHAEPIDTHQPLFDIDVVSETDAWAVGGIDVPVILHYDGESWASVGAPETSGLRALHMLDADEGWAVGVGGAIVRYDGHDWIEVESPTSGLLTGVHMFSPDIGWAVGADDWGRAGIILAFEGGRWVVDLEGRTPILTSVRTLGPFTALAVGEYGVLEYFDGEGWREVGRTYPKGFTAGFAAKGGSETTGSGVDDRVAVLRAPGPASPLADATARDYRFARRSATTDWQEPRTPQDSVLQSYVQGGGRRSTHPRGGLLNTIVLLPGSETLLAMGDMGQIVQIDDMRWSEVHAGRTFTALDMFSSDEGWIVGPDGPPLHWDGTRWSAVRVPRRAHWLRDVDVVSPTDAWAVGENGAIAHWDGRTWTTLPPLTRADLTAVSFSKPDDGWTFTSFQRSGSFFDETYILHWDGAQWSQALHLCSPRLNDVAARSPSDVWFAAGSDTLLHFDGSSWWWVPVHGRDRPGDIVGSLSMLALTPSGGFASGQDAARFDGLTWRAIPAERPWHGYALDIAAVADDSFWDVTLAWRYASEALSVNTISYSDMWLNPVEDAPLLASRSPLVLNAIDVLQDRDGTLEVWAAGESSTVLHYRSSAPDARVPEPTATALVAVPTSYPTPTPRSSFRQDDIRGIVLDLTDPEGSGSVHVPRIELVTRGDIPGLLDELRADYAWLKSWYGWDNRECYTWQPLWFAMAAGSPACAHWRVGGPVSHAAVFLDAQTGEVVRYVCLREWQGKAILPLAMGGGMERVLEALPTRVPRNVTPRPAENVLGVCPTPTPDRPPGGWPYPGP